MNLNEHVMIVAKLMFEDNLKIVKEIYDRWPNVRVKCLDPDQFPDLTDKPYLITEICQDGQERIIFGVDELDQRVIDHLYKIDQVNINPLESLDEIAAKAQKEKEAKEEEDRAARVDLITVGTKHFSRGKLKFKFTNEDGEKKVVG